MKPAPFRYAAPASLEEALALLCEHGHGAKLMAGGQSLMPMMNLRIARPEVVIDANRIPGLAGWQRDAGGLRIGALARQCVLEDPAGPSGAAPLLAAAIRHIGHVATRGRGTIGGSVAHADPAAELPCCMLALDATLLARSRHGERAIPAAGFFTGVFATALEPDEMLCEIRLPPPLPASGAAFLEIARRPGDFAMVAVAAVLALAPDRSVSKASLALAGVGDTPLRIPEAEAALAGQPAGEGAWAEAGRIVARAIDPATDLHATAAYRRKVSAVLTERALAEACRMAAQGMS